MHFTTQYHMYLHWCPAPCCWAVCHVEQCTHTHTHFSWWTVLVAFSFDAINPRQTLCRGPNDLILINYVALVWTIRSIKKVGSFRKHRKVVAFRFWEVIKGASRRLFPLALSSLIRTRLIDSDSGLRLEHDLSLKVRTAVGVIVCASPYVGMRQLAHCIVISVCICVWLCVRACRRIGDWLAAVALIFIKETWGDWQ